MRISISRNWRRCKGNQYNIYTFIYTCKLKRIEFMIDSVIYSWIRSLMNGISGYLRKEWVKPWSDVVFALGSAILLVNVICILPSYLSNRKVIRADIFPAFRRHGFGIGCHV